MKKPMNKIHILYLLFVFFLGVLFRSSPLLVGKVVMDNTYRISVNRSNLRYNSKKIIKNNLGGIADRKPIIVIDKLGIVEHHKEV